MDSVIEIKRQTHEEIEHLEKALYTILSKPQPAHEGRLQTEHKASKILDRISSRVATLNDLYQDDETSKAEVEAISSKDPGDLKEFYSRLGKITEHYAKYPESMNLGFELELASFLDEPEPAEDDEEYEEEDRRSPYCNTHSTRSTFHSHCSTVLGRGAIWQIS